MSTLFDSKYVPFVREIMLLFIVDERFAARSRQTTDDADGGGSARDVDVDDASVDDVARKL